MRLFVHGIKSLIRRPVKTLMLFAILFIVFNLVFTGFIIENSIDESKEYIRNEIGAAVEYRTDVMGAKMNGQKSSGISLSVAKKIAENNHVKDYFVTELANVNSQDIQASETQEDKGGFRKGFSDFTLQGTNNEIPLDFALERVSLIEGNMLTQQNIDNGDYVVLISKELAKDNNLRLGDKISIEKVANPKINSGSTGASENFEIIGIYSALNKDYNANNLFTSLVVTNEFNGTTGRDEIFANVIYLLDDPMEVEQFKGEVSHLLTSEYQELYSNDDEFEELTRPLDLISVIAKILIWVVFIAGAAIILAIVTIFVRDRKFEIGLLLSSGEGKGKIVAQFMFEMLVIAIIAFGISVGTSNIASKGVSNWIVQEQLLSDSGIASNDSTDSEKLAKYFLNNNTDSIYGDISMENVAEEFDVSLSPKVMGNLLLVSIVLVLIGSMIPLSIIMSFNPKRILQD